MIVTDTRANLAAQRVVDSAIIYKQIVWEDAYRALEILRDKRKVNKQTNAEHTQEVNLASALKVFDKYDGFLEYIKAKEPYDDLSFT